MNFYRSRPAVVPAMSENVGSATPAPEQPGASYVPLLAVPYVLPQTWGQVYDSAAALRRGTIFPSLDLPFTGMGGAR